MISTELMIVLLVFLVYIGVWYLYMNGFMEVIDSAMQGLYARSAADTIAHGINVVCINSGSLKIDLNNRHEVKGDGKRITVDNIVKEVDCEVSGAVNGTVVRISKRDGGVSIA